MSALFSPNNDDMKWHIPGSIEVEGREFAYVEAENFEKFVSMALAPDNDLPMPRSGGIIEEKASLVLPEGQRLYGLSYKGDVEAWQKLVLGHCRRHGLLFGVVAGQRLLLSTGSEFKLSELDFRQEQ